MHAILFSVVGWLIREVIVKAVVVAAIYGALVVLAPIVVEYAADFVSPAALTSAFTALPAGLWWFLDWFRVGYGVPIVIAAYVARFMIRRIPLVG